MCVATVRVWMWGISPTVREGSSIRGALPDGRANAPETTDTLTRCRAVLKMFLPHAKRNKGLAILATAWI